jgi:hypothetical protein
MASCWNELPHGASRLKGDDLVDPFERLLQGLNYRLHSSLASGKAFNSALASRQEG